MYVCSITRRHEIHQTWQILSRKYYDSFIRMILASTRDFLYLTSDLCLLPQPIPDVTTRKVQSERYFYLIWRIQPIHLDFLFLHLILLFSRSFFSWKSIEVKFKARYNLSKTGFLCEVWKCVLQNDNIWRDFPTKTSDFQRVVHL